QIWNHTGGDLGIATLLAFNPDNSTGFIILTNGEDNTLSGCTTSDDIFCRLLHIADTISTASSPDLNCSYAEFPCQHSKTYWKNHNDEWALNSVPMKLGTTHFYGQNKLLNLLNKPINGNASTVLAKQLIAAKLNVAQGSETTPIYSVINAANDLIGNRQLPIQPGISFFSSEGIQMLALSLQLASYNYGVLNTKPCNGNANGNRNDAIQLEDIYENDLTEQSLIISPNPLSSSTTISFSLNELQNVSLKVFDLNGRLIKTLADNIFEEGEHSIEWKAENVNAGIYFLQVQTAEYSKTEKLIFTK
ncbi:MAG: T9SS type A sorting domain-containing protein, partial [Bacteroidota bacterium]